MISWQGREYSLVPSQYNGAVIGYLLDGVFHVTKPTAGKVKGHIVTEAGAVIILKRDPALPIALAIVAALILAFALWPRQQTVYYQATFSVCPAFSEGTLYCNVINESEIVVTVQFLNGTDKSIVYELSPGETLPRVYVDFAPTTIRYNGNYDFPLEVRCD